MNKWYIKTLITVAVAGSLIFFALFFILKPLIPSAIKKQVTTILFVPKADNIVVDRESVKYAADLKLLTFNAAMDGRILVISQQPTPDSFTDIPQVYDKVVTNMNEYQKFDTDVGTAHLTRPKDLGGKQAAVLSAKGTLMFAKPDRDLSDDQWRKFFNSLDIVR